MSNVRLLDDGSFEEAVTTTDHPVMVAFVSPSCPHCHQMAPTIDAIARETAGRAVVAKVDVTRSPATTKVAGVRQLPTFVFFRQGQEVARKTGSGAAPAALRGLLR